MMTPCTTFSPCGNPFLGAMTVRKDAPEPAKTPVFDKLSLARYYEWIGKPVPTQQAAEYFDVANHAVYEASKRLSRDGCLNRIKDPMVTPNGTITWRYLYEFVCLPAQPAEGKVEETIRFLESNPGATAASFAKQHDGRTSNASATLLTLLNRGLVKRTAPMPYKYWLTTRP